MPSSSPSSEPAEPSEVLAFDADLAQARGADERMRLLIEHVRALLERQIRNHSDLKIQIQHHGALLANWAEASLGFSADNVRRHQATEATLAGHGDSLGAISEQVGGITREIAAIRADNAAERAARTQQDSVHEVAIASTRGALARTQVKAVGLRSLAWALGLGLAKALEHLLTRM